MVNDAFSAQDDRGRALWAAFFIIAVISIYLGFEDDVTNRFSGSAPYPASWQLELHVWTLGAWMVLLIVQLALAGTQRTAWHRKLGLTAVILVPLAVLSGFWAEVLSERHWEALYPDYVRFLHVPIAQMGGFGIFAALAIYWRKSPSIHRRLMYLATASIVAAAWGRAWRDSLVMPMLESSPAFVSEFFGFHFGFMVMAVAAALFDWRATGKVHPAIGWGSGLMIMVMAVLVALTLTDWWPDFGRLLIGL